MLKDDRGRRVSTAQNTLTSFHNPRLTTEPLGLCSARAAAEGNEKEVSDFVEKLGHTHSAPASMASWSGLNYEEVIN